MKIRTMLGLAALGGLLYAHRQHGGEWTLASFRESLNDLFDSLRASAERAKEEALDKMRETAHQVEQSAQAASEQIGSNGRR